MLRTYSVAELVVMYGGVRLTGWVDGEFMTIAYDDDIFKETNGADGEVARVKSKKLMATATLRFLQTAPVNDILSGFLLADIVGNITLPFLVKDLNGNTIAFAAQAYLKKFADVAYGTENINREWTMKLPVLDEFVGGNFITI